MYYVPPSPEGDTYLGFVALNHGVAAVYAHPQDLPYRLTLMTAYVTDIAKRMSQAWSSAGDAIKKAQVQQKQQHDVRSNPMTSRE